MPGRGIPCPSARAEIVAKWATSSGTSQSGVTNRASAAALRKKSSARPHIAPGIASPAGAPGAGEGSGVGVIGSRFSQAEKESGSSTARR